MSPPPIEPIASGHRRDAPALSVGIPNYNHAPFLIEALGALLGQSYRPLEIIVIDDHSTDDSMAVLERLAAEHPIIRLHRNDQNVGVVATMSRMTELARGDYILYAAADDKVLPGLLEKSMAMLAHYPQAGLCSTATIRIDERGRDRGLVRRTVGSKTARYFSPREVRSRLGECEHDDWFVTGNTTVYRRDAIIEAGGFREELHGFADGFLSRVIALRHGLCHIPEPLGTWRDIATGYANVSCRDPVVAQITMEAVESLISTAYADLFPQGYLEHMKRRLELEVRLGKLSRRHAWARERLAASHALPSRVGGVVYASLALGLSAHHQSAKVWLRGRLGLPIAGPAARKLQEGVERAALVARRGRAADVARTLDR